MPKDTYLIHNRFDFEVRDAASGKVKQRARAFNIVLDNFFKLISNSTALYYTGDYMKSIAIGQGTGTPAVTDTALFNQITTYTTTQAQTVYQYPTSYRQVKITIPATDQNGKTITEVGLVYSNGTVSPSVPSSLITKAMLKDSEGNQIAITKTETDVIVITATLYVTISLAGFGTGGIYPTAPNNAILQWIFSTDTGWSDHYPDWYCRLGRWPLPYSSDLNARGSFKKSMNIQSATSATNGQIDMPLVTILNSEGTGHLAKHLGSPGVGAFTFPNHDVFPPVQVSNLALGTGDGTTTDFNIGCPLIMEGSEQIYVDGVLMTKGTDYLIDYENNCGDWHENYYTGAMTAMDDGVSFGNFKTGDKTNYSGLRDPLTHGDVNYAANVIPGDISISQATPVQIDFGTGKKCNCLKLVSAGYYNYNSGSWPSTTYLQQMKVQYLN